MVIHNIIFTEPTARDDDEDRLLAGGPNGGRALTLVVTCLYDQHVERKVMSSESEPAKPRRRLASMISVRLSSDEAEAIRAAAEREGLSVSAFLRAAALKEARRGGMPARPSPVLPVLSFPASH